MEIWYWGQEYQKIIMSLLQFSRWKKTMVWPKVVTVEVVETINSGYVFGRSLSCDSWDPLASCTKWWEALFCTPGLFHQSISYRRYGRTSALEGLLEAGHLVEKKRTEILGLVFTLWSLGFWRRWVRMRLMPHNKRWFIWNSQWSHTSKLKVEAGSYCKKAHDLKAPNLTKFSSESVYSNLSHNAGVPGPASQSM